MSDESATNPAVEFPWRGLKPYEAADAGRFVGRESELARLQSMVATEKLVVLLGASGMGKTSLIQAGLTPWLLERNFLPCRILFNFESGAPLIEDVHSALVRVARERGAELPHRVEGDTLWQYFNRVESEIWSADNQPLVPVLIFDQFEEVFTLGQSSSENRSRVEEMIEDVSALIEGRAPESVARDERLTGQYHVSDVPVRIILSLREDFLPDLDGLRGRIRGLHQSHLRLLPMNASQARKVIRLGSHLLAEGSEQAVLQFASRESLGVEKEGEADEQRHIFSPALLSFFLDELSRKLAAERSLHMLSTLYAPVDLLRASKTGFRAPSVTSRELRAQWLVAGTAARARRDSPPSLLALPEQNGPPKSQSISPEMVATEGNQIFDQFYQRCIADLPSSVARFIESRLLTPQGNYRESVDLDTWRMEMRKTGENDPDKVLSTLETRRLLNQENRGRPRVELSHDVLVAPVRRARDTRNLEEENKRHASEAAAYRRKLMFAGTVAVVMSLLGVYSAWKWIEQRDEDVKTETAKLLLECAMREKLAEAAQEEIRVRLDEPSTLWLIETINGTLGGKLDSSLSVISGAGTNSIILNKEIQATVEPGINPSIQRALHEDQTSEQTATLSIRIDRVFPRTGRLLLEHLQNRSALRDALKELLQELKPESQAAAALPGQP